MNTKPSPYLPAWALEWFNAQRHRFDDPEEMPHRRDAFYRLLCSGENNRGMRNMWQRVALHKLGELDGDTFLGVLIYSMDDVLEDERRPVYSRPPVIAETRLREPDRRLARKLARLLRELRIVTPPRCAAKRTVSSGIPVERLVIAYGFDLAPDDINDIYRRHGIEYTADSKRGRIQRRRASDAVRAKAIEAARKLSEIGRPQDAGWLGTLADELQRLPDMETEHRSQPEMRSNKTGWPDWLRVAHHGLQGDDNLENILRPVDWAALVRTLFDDVDVSEVRIGQVLKERQ